MKFAQKFAVAAVALMGMSASAKAQAINFVGSTQFCWAATGVPICPTFANTATLGGLTITSGNFNVTTLNGFAAIGGGVGNLGNLALTNTTFSYAGFSLFMKVTFTSPTGAGTQTFNSILVGSVNASAQGGVQISYSPNSASGTFTLPGPVIGGYTLSLNNASVTPTQGTEFTGTITATTAPEPSTYALLAAGLAMIGVVARRRRNVVA